MDCPVGDRRTPQGAGLPDPEPSLFGQGPPDPAVTPPPEPEGDEELTPEELKARNIELEARLEERTSTLDALIERAPPAAAAAAPIRKPAPPNPGPAPDAATDGEAFSKWLDARDAYREYHSDQKIEGLRADHDRDALLSQLWSDFQRDYPEQAKDRDFVSAAFQVATGGRIPADAAGQKKMLKDIAGRIKAQGAPAPKDPDDKPADRTGGLSRGSRSSPRKKSPESDERPKSLKDQIGDRQMNSPFF